MKTLKYEVQINSPKEIVWNTIISKQTYGKWTKAFSANSEYSGEWKQGAELMFFDGNMGGTIAKLDIVKPFEKIVATHIATMTSNRVIAKKGVMVEKRIGSKETYELENYESQTILKVTILVDQELKEMFDLSWPQALKSIKKLSENEV